MYDEKGTLVRWNKTLETISGYSSTELLLMTIFDWFSPFDKQKVRHAVERILNHGEKSDVEAGLIIKNGKTIPYYFAGVRMTINGTKHLVGVGTDITKLEKTKGLLKASEEKYRTMMETTLDATYICSPDFKIEYMNPAMIRRIGRDATGEICYKALHDLVKKCSWCLHHKVQKSEYVSQTIISPSDNHSFHISHAPIQNRDGSISKMAVHRDITQLKQSEELLKISEWNLQRAQRLSKIGNWYYDQVSQTKIWSDECFKLYDLKKENYPDNVVPESINEKVYEEPEKIQKLSESLAEKHDTYELEFTTVPINGQVKTIHSYCEVERDNNGNILKVFGADHDVTKRVDTENKLKKSHAELSELNKHLKKAMFVSSQATADAEIQNYQLKLEIQQRVHSENINKALFEISNAVNTTDNLDDLYRTIYDSLNHLIELPNFFIAIVDNEKKLLSFPFFVDEHDTQQTITMGLEKYVESTSNTSRVISTKKPLFLKKEILKKRLRQQKTIGTISVIWIGVPLIVRNEVIGVIVTQHYSDPEYFTQQDLNLLIAVSDQAALAIDRKKSQEKIKQNEKITQTLFSISNAVNTTDNLNDLYRSIYDSLNHIIKLPNFFIAIVDSEKKQLNYPLYLDEYDSEDTISFTVDYIESSNYITVDVIKSKKPLLLTKEMVEKRVEQGRISGAIPKIWLGVPLIIRDTVIGVMAVQHYKDPEYFTQKDMDLLIAVSDQIALAIDRKQFQEDLRKATKKTESTNIKLKNEILERKHSEDINKALFAISNAVNITLNLSDLYRQIHNLLGEIIDVTNFFIAIINNKEKTLHFPYHVDLADDDFSPITNFNPKNSLTGLVVSRRKPILLTKDELKSLDNKKEVWGTVSLIWMGVPLMIKDEVIGVIAVQSYTDPYLYNEKDLQVLSSISDQVAIAIDRKQTEDELRESEKKYRHIFNNAPAGMYEIDFIKQKFIEVNDVLCKYTGYSEDEFLSIKPLDLLTDKSKKQFIVDYETVLNGGKISNDVEYSIIRKNGQILSAILKSDFIFKEGKLVGARVVVHDITKRKALEENLKRLASTDPLTGTNNRRSFLDKGDFE
ncbi:MAG: PAS domain S-box protein, partial [Desulfobacula sp.]|nr:PAS domain S-box protein [Desulfobacula sp.]